MYPQLFLKTFWRLELEPQVFVAMSLADEYRSRFEDVIKPAICSLTVDGIQLTPKRVDLSKTGDTMLSSPAIRTISAYAAVSSSLTRRLFACARIRPQQYFPQCRSRS